MIGLTHVQAQCLEFIGAYQDSRGGVSPSYREIADAVGFSSISRVHEVMECLAERGAIEKLDGKSRSVKILGGDISRTVILSADLITKLDAYAKAEGITRDLAAGQFIRDGLEAA
jgi:SOS-response transcriptional repressor LexA